MTESPNAIEVLESQQAAVTPEDTMGEAARKALLQDFIQMLKNEAGSRTGDDISHVHDMRVATRRMRSIFSLMENYFKPKTLLAFRKPLKKIAGSLGSVRDLDVMIDNLTRFQGTLPDEHKEAVQGVVNYLTERRAKARQRLVRQLDKSDYQRFREAFSTFVTTPGSGVRNSHENGDEPAPVEVRHILPIAVYSHLASVRAYDEVVAEDTSIESLHLLRIEFKRLRYLISMFDEILGKSGKEFIGELKAIQDHLGKLNDAVVAQATLSDLLPSLEEAQAAALERYLQMLVQEEERLQTSFPELWRHFNGKTVQRQLATALAGL